MRNKNNKNYMEDIYDVIYAPEVEYDDDGIEYLDSPDDELIYGYDDELSWADDITYLDDPEDDEFDLDLGEGFIPLPQGDVYEEELVVIDEHYILDEFECDIIEDYVQPAIEQQEEDDDYGIEDIYNIINEDDEIVLNVDEAESLIKFPGQQTVEEELQVPELSEEDDKIAKAIAKEHIENVKAGEVAGGLFGDVENPDDDTSWVNDDDLFGNNIDVIIADDPNKEVEENDYVEGSFQQWLDQQNQ